MRTHKTLLPLFGFLVAVPVAAAVYLGTTGLKQQRELLVAGEIQTLNGRADDLRAGLVRRLQEMYREEFERFYGDYKQAFVVSRREGEEDVIVPSPFVHNDRSAILHDRFEFGMNGLEFPWSSEALDAPNDLLQLLIESERFASWLERRDGLDRNSGARIEEVPPQKVAWNVPLQPVQTAYGERQGRARSTLAVTYSPLVLFGDFAIRKISFGGRARVAQGFRVDAERVQQRFLDPSSDDSLVRRRDVNISAARLVPGAGAVEPEPDEHGLPRRLYRYVVPPPAERDATPVLLPDGFRLSVDVRPSSNFFSTLESAESRLAWVLAAVVFVALLGLLFGWRAVKTESVLAARRTEFVSAVSHELRTPLTSIRMYADLLKEGWVGDEQTKREYFGLIATESDRLARLVNNVLDFSRIEKGKKRFLKVAGDPAPVVREAAEMFRPSIEEKGYRLHVDVPEELPPCEFDKDALTQILVNLIDNAAKYGCEGEAAEVRIEAECTDDKVLFRILDRGPGVPRGERSRIFHEFHRGSNAAPGGGSGLGLALVSHYVTAHGGTLQVGDRVGGGAVFSFTLPRA